jgi:hypothetical protein
MTPPAPGPAPGHDGHKDYSATPLWRKLGIREGSRVRLVNAPDGFEDRLEPLPEGAAVLVRSARDLDVVVIFATELAELRRRFAELAPAIPPTGLLWVAWPKKASKVPTDIAFADAQGIGLDASLVDNKTAALSEVFQGLQFVVRLEDRPR